MCHLPPKKQELSILSPRNIHESTIFNNVNHVQQLYMCHLPPKKKNYQFFRLACFVCLFFSSVFCSSFVLLFFFGWESDSLSLLRWSIMWPCARLDWAESGVFSSVFSSFFFFSLLHVSKITWFYCAGDKKYCSCIVHALFMYCSWTFKFLEI